MAVAPDLELDLGGLLVLLYPGGYIVRNIISFSFGNRNRVALYSGAFCDVQEASFRLQISMNCLMSVTSLGMMGG